MNLTRIVTASAKSGYAAVDVKLDGEPDYTPVLVYWGEQLLGQANLAGGKATVPLSRPLAAGDVINAYKTERGVQGGPPVTVQPSGVGLGRWVSPTEITVYGLNGNAQPVAMSIGTFYSTFGYYPSDAENPAGSPLLTTPEFIDAPQQPIGFDMQIERQGGQTSVLITGVRNARGGVVVKWSDESSYSNTLQRAFTAGGTFSVSVKGSQNTDSEAVSRSVSITITSPPPAAPAPDPAIEYKFWRNFGSTVCVYVNTSVEVEAQILNSSSGPAWVPGGIYDDQHERQIFFQGVPDGPLSITLRKKGETNPAKYHLITATKYPH